MEDARSSVINRRLLLPALLGMAAGMAAIALWWLLYRLDLSPFAPFDLGDYLIWRSPGGFATWSIETLGSMAQDAALVGGVLAWLIVWAPIGVLVDRFRERSLVWLAPMPLLPAAIALGWWAEDWSGFGDAVGPVFVYALTLAGAGALLQRWLQRVADIEQQTALPDENWLDQPGNYERRALMRQVGLIVLAAGVGAPVIGRLFGELGTSGPTTAQQMPLNAALAAYGTPETFPTPAPADPLPDQFVASPGTRPRVTDNDEFYVVDISTRDPALYEGSWSLRIHGLVEQEVVLTWPELLALPSIELDGTLMCISYEHDNGLISTTRWTGVRLRDVLAMAGIGAGTVDLICRGDNGYSDSIPLANALEPTTLLAYGMNGTTLPREHGFPCRLYVPGLYGEKNVKWLQEIELSDQDYLGFWQERGWTDIAIVNTVSIIDTPRGDVLRDTGSVPVGGIAFAGDRGISRVQLRIDDGEWFDAELEPNEPPLIWQRWRYDWQPAFGSYRLTVRAIDDDGIPQDENERPPHPDGMTGLHVVSVDVV
jgi:DMSO/TMAO reductase YedYZ molybdopterin-dependent catalytic subunit